MKGFNKYWWTVGAGAALLAQMTFSRHLGTGFAYVDFLLLFVIYHATTKSEEGGLLSGAIAGLLQDSFSGGPFGVFGISKTIIGFGLGKVCGKFLVSKSLLYPAVIGAASLIHDLMLVLLLNVAGYSGYNLSPLQVVYRLLWNVFMGVVLLIPIHRAFQKRHQVA